MEHFFFSASSTLLKRFFASTFPTTRLRRNQHHAGWQRSTAKMPQSGSPFAGPSTPKAAHALSPFGKNSQNAATLLGKGQPSKKQPPSNSQSPRSSPGPKAAAAGGSSPYSQRIASLAAAAAPPESPLLPREAETTFHRKLRTLLQQYATQAETWEETATFDGLKWAKMAVDCWSDLE